MEVNGLEGTVKHIVFQSVDDEFTVARFKTEAETITVVGMLYGVQRENQLKIWGKIKNHPKYGKQIEITRWEKPLPSGREQIIDYLIAVVKNVGKSRAQVIVDSLGENCLQVILERGPEVLAAIQGIGPKKAGQIYNCLAENLELQYVMTALLPFGITARTAIKAFKEWGYNAIAVVKTNPYLLNDITPLGFYKADEIAGNIGLPEDSPFRLQAAIKHVLMEAEGNGHCYEVRDQLIKSAMDLLRQREENDRLNLLAALEVMLANRKLVLEGDQVYLQRLYDAELKVAEQVSRLFVPKPFASPEKISAYLEDFERKHDLALAPDQKQAVEQIFKSSLLILTGGPGTGKTLTVNAVIDVLRRVREEAKVLLASPTGRAGQNLAEITGEEAGTIHRLLNFRPGEGPEYDQGNPLECDLLVVDEVSMLDITLAALLFDAVEPVRTRVLLVGDADQLPSVGPGNVLHDLIAAGAPIVKLNHIFRQAAESQIVTNAHRVNNGQPIAVDHSRGDFYFLEQEQPQKIAKIIRASALRFREMGYSPEDLQVLSPMRKGPIGTIMLNEILQASLNPSAPGKEEVQIGESVYRLGDRVMQLKNNYSKQVFNGDIGLIEAIVPENSKQGTELNIKVRIRGELIEYIREEALEELALAYCMTIHKAQGGEIPVVIMPVSTCHYIMLARNLLYTGITRAKQKVVLVGTVKALKIAVGNNKTARRNTGLTKKLILAIGIN